MKGWVYVISTKTHDLLKIGYTNRDPEVRAGELNDTSSPHPHIVEYAALVANARSVEIKAHRALRTKNESKEWFRCSIEEAVLCIREASSEIMYEDMQYEIRRNIEEQERRKAEEERRNSGRQIIAHYKALEEKRLQKIEAERIRAIKIKNQAEQKIQGNRRAAIRKEVKRRSSFYINFENFFPQNRYLILLFIFTPLFAFYSLPVCMFIFSYNAIFSKMLEKEVRVAIAREENTT